VDIVIVNAQRNSIHRVSQSAAIATSKTGNRRIQQVTDAALMQNGNYSTEGICEQQNRDQHEGRFSPYTQHLTDHSSLIFAAEISSICSNNPNKNSKSLREKSTQQDTTQISGQSMQAKNVHINATDVILAFAMVQQVMTEFSGTATKQISFAVITKAVFRLLKNIANNSS
jgi:hypothetical protein